MMMKRVLALLAALMMLLTFALAESQDTVIATVNGEELLYSDYVSIESAYLYQYEAAGVDLTNAEVYAYLQDLALTYAIEQMLIKQDMRAQGCYDFDEESESWFQEIGKATYDQAIQDVMDAMRTEGVSDDELMVYALAYAQSLNVTEETYVEFYRTQYAAARYYEWLTQDNPVTDADVMTAYAERVAQSESLYANDVAAFENAMNAGNEVWYKPEGYRSILQILLPAEGATAEEKLLNAQPTVDAINTRLADGESFQALMAEYSIDANTSNEAFLATGYQVHRESVIWEDLFVDTAFSADMTQPGDVSQPFASDLGVHILYYLCDSPAGAVELTQDVYDALSYAIYTERYTAAQTERINALADAAEIIFH